MVYRDDGKSKLGCKTLFATHYHELVVLGEDLPRAFNLNVAVQEFGDRFIFLRKIIEGGADRSYGVHVAEMAGLPYAVIQRAKELLSEHNQGENNKLPQASLETKPQMDLFSKKETAIKKALEEIDIDAMTPLAALSKLDELKKKHGI